MKTTTNTAAHIPADENIPADAVVTKIRGTIKVDIYGDNDNDTCSWWYRGTEIIFDSAETYDKWSIRGLTFQSLTAAKRYIDSK